MIDDLYWASRYRCPGCRMHLTLCLCAHVPTCETRTRVVLVLHHLELNKTSNTGHLAIACLPNGETVVHGGPGAPTRDLGDLPQPLLLFPHPAARPLSDWRGTESPITLVVPDATWSQAMKARRRIPGLQDMPCALLPPDLPSRYRLRLASTAGHLSTF